MPALVVSPKSAIALRKLLRTARTIIPNQGRGERGRVPLLVRCTSATAAGGSGISAQCFPAVVLDPVSDELVADQPTLGNVWLTVLDHTGSVTPTVNKQYLGLLSGEHTEGSDTRPRVFASLQSGGGGTLTVKEVDGSPSLSSITELQFDQADGFTISSGPAIARIDMLPASTTQTGVVTITTQNIGGSKIFHNAIYSYQYIVSITPGSTDQIGQLTSGGFSAGGMTGTGPALIRPGPTPSSFPHTGTFAVTWSTPNNEYIAMLRSSGGFGGNSPGVRFAVGGETSGISGVSLGQHATIPGVGTFVGGILINVSGGQIINGGSF